MIKLIYSEKVTKFCKISTVDLAYVVSVKSMVEISQIFLSFSEYMNFSSGTSQYVGYKNPFRKRVHRKKVYSEECQICTCKLYENNWEQKFEQSINLL